MGLSRGVKDGLATPVFIANEEVEMGQRKVKIDPATPVYIINHDDICVDCEGGSGGGDLDYTHNQIVPSTTWNITHNLNKFPSVTIVDSGGTVVIGDVTHINNDSLTVTFNSAFAGKAYLN